MSNEKQGKELFQVPPLPHQSRSGESQSVHDLPRISRGVSDKRLAEGNDTDENWSEILAEINKCSEEQLDKLFYMTKIK